MSISGVGAAGSVGVDQILARMLSRLDSTNATSSTSNSTSSTTNAAAVSPTAEGAPPPSLTGTGQSALSDQIMALLVQLQQQSNAQGAQSATTATTSTTAQTTNANDPVQQLFSAMDADGDGTVSQAEMEGYVEGKGGTQAQADSLFAQLNQNAGASSGGGISEQQLGTDVSQVQHSGHRHHHHHGGSGMSQADQGSSTDIASQIFSALDGNQDGSVSKDEFSAAFATNSATSGNGTPASDPSALFAQIDGNSDGSVSSGEIGTFLASLTKQVQSDFSTLGAFGQLAVQSYDASSNLLDKTSSGQSSFA
jgi:Ca2+-binding EF-hand superfamily protein